MAVKNENYIIIQGWMISELKLKGNELLVYAIIYGFSQDGESCFSGSRNYLAEWCNASLPTIDNALKSLCDKKLIIKNQEKRNNVIFNTYKVFWGGVKNLYRGYKETLQGCKKTLYNNIDNNIDIYNIYNNKINKEEINKEEKIETLYSLIERNFGRMLSPIEYEEISKWKDNEITRYAIKEAVLRRALNIKYISAIIRDCEAKGIKTIKDIKRPVTAENEAKNDELLYDYNWLEDEE